MLVNASPFVTAWLPVLIALLVAFNAARLTAFVAIALVRAELIAATKALLVDITSALSASEFVPVR